MYDLPYYYSLPAKVTAIKISDFESSNHKNTTQTRIFY